MMSRDTSESASGEEALFHAARSLPDRTAREAFLVAACQGRSELRARVEGLLTASEDSAAFFGAGPGAPVLTKGLVVGARLGNYEVLSEIGRGGMGRVYRATEVSTRRVVALKVIGAGSAADSTQVRRFQTEAQAAAQLHHPNIVTIHEAGFCDGVWFFSMDLIDGQPLSTLLASTFLPSAVEVKPGTGMNGFLEDSFSLVQFCKIVRAVHYAHEHGGTASGFEAGQHFGGF